MKFPLQLSCFCLLSLFGEILGQQDVVGVNEGSDAILPCSLSTKENLTSKLFDWKKDDQKEVFLYDKGATYNNGRSGQDDQFKGRVSHFEDELQHGNASIKIINTKLSDGGVYSCIFPRLQPRQTFLIQLVVGTAGNPSVTTLDTKNWAQLQCVVRDAKPKPEVEWRDSAGNIVHAEEPQVTPKGGGSYDIILKAKVTKADNYSCVVTQEEINHQTEAKIYVHTGEASKPFVTTLKTEDGVMLQCVVQDASPKPKVEWRDSDGNILHAEEPQVSKRGGSYDIILKAKVTETDNYHCVVTQEEINHQTEAEIYVPIIGEASKPFVVTLKTKAGVMLQCVVQGAFPKPKVEWRDSAGNILHAEEPQVTKRGGSYDIILITEVTETDNYHCVVTQEEIKHRTEAEIYVHIIDHTWWNVGVVFIILSVLLGVPAGLYIKERLNRIRANVGQPEEMNPMKGLVRMSQLSGSVQTLMLANVRQTAETNPMKGAGDNASTGV